MYCKCLNMNVTDCTRCNEDKDKTSTNLNKERMR